MNGGIAPFLLLAVTVGLMLGLAEARVALLGTVALIVAAVVGWALPITAAQTPLFAGLFLAMLAAGISIYSPAVRHRVWVLLLAMNGGLWLGVCAAASNSLTGLATIIVTLAVMAGSRWTVQRKMTIIVKVTASWMIAIASLALSVSLLPTPGYQADHME